LMGLGTAFKMGTLSKMGNRATGNLLKEAIAKKRGITAAPFAGGKAQIPYP